MSIGCLYCFKVICFMKKHIKKEDIKPLKAEGLTKVGEKDANNSVEKKKPETCKEPVYRLIECSSRVGSSNMEEYESEGFYVGVSSSPMTNDFNKVKTFDFREVAKATAK
ncbi:uncharacterized protein LOC117127789 [Brassica rapa]|uniref:Uncharacterized protein n=1 Tax=Brassica campestris TaxID=3711 RepID=A0A3P5YN38_BRACM|nr:uncharacterized protein LOC106350850 [Brassica napus]XP_013665875.2 uncharacterized protein LOC106370413 [Brassica napus]XP_033134346.1 uncharacterized protein LOC117127789 [Brassica rapa]VDC61408.1 unnamed protein product [Brassica rapa]